MQKQAEEDILLESLIPNISLESLIKGYHLHCKTEGKSPETISGYKMVLNNFMGKCCHIAGYASVITLLFGFSMRLTN